MSVTTEPRPTYIDTKFVKTFTRRPFDDGDDLVYVLTWADGSVTERDTIPNEWHGLYVECLKARQAKNAAALDASLCTLAAEHAEGRIGSVPVGAPALELAQVA